MVWSSWVKPGEVWLTSPRVSFDLIFIAVKAEERSLIICIRLVATVGTTLVICCCSWSFT